MKGYMIFFKDYFTDTGSIYYTYNELNKNTYEKVYSENEDVSLFWKTQMLYYVKLIYYIRILNLKLMI